MEPQKKQKNILAFVIGGVTLVLAGVGVFTALKLYQLRNEAVAPNAPQSQPGATGCSVEFDERDHLYCSPSQGQVTVTGKVLSVPPNSTLQTSWYIVSPQSVKTSQIYATKPVISGDTFSVTGTWPGTSVAQPGETVEIHFGLNVLDANGNPQASCTGSLDYYWSQALQVQCTQTASPSPSPSGSPTGSPSSSPSSSPSASPSPSPSASPNTCVMTFNLTGTGTPTPTPTETPTSTPTSTPTGTPTSTPTTTPSSTPTTTPRPSGTGTPAPTGTPQALPAAGSGLYTYAGLGAGIIFILVAILVAL